MPNSATAFGVGGHGDEVLGHRVVAGRAAQPGQEPVPGRRRVGQRLEGGEGLGADDEQRGLRVEVVGGGVEVDRVDVGDEATGQARLGVVGQGHGGHGRTEVRTADADVDDGRDPLARWPPSTCRCGCGRRGRPSWRARRARRRRRPGRRRGATLPGGMRSATWSTARSSVVLMCSPGEHGVAVRLDLGRPGQVHQEAQRLVGHPLLRVVEDEVRRPRRHALGPLRVVGEEFAEVSRRDRVVVRRQGLPLRCRS